MGSAIRGRSRLRSREAATAAKVEIGTSRRARVLRRTESSGAEVSDGCAARCAAARLRASSASHEIEVRDSSRSVEPLISFGRAKTTNRFRTAVPRAISRGVVTTVIVGRRSLRPRRASDYCRQFPTIAGAVGGFDSERAVDWRVAGVFGGLAGVVMR